MGRMARRRVGSHSWLTRPCWSTCRIFADCCWGEEDIQNTHDDEDGGESDEEEENITDDKPQYTLKSRRRVVSSSFIVHAFPCPDFFSGKC